jgi:hypothetical protein
MTLGLAGVLADARALWRGERDLILAIAGVFFVVPMLAMVLLLAQSGFGQVAPEKLREAAAAFYAANLLPILLANAMIEFGTFAVLNLLLQGNGRTLGEVLLLTLRRFLPFLGISLIGGFLFSLGISLFVVPGLFAFGRTWLAGASYAARPEAGPIEAFRQGWRRSGGFGWVTLLAAAAITMMAAIVLIVISTMIISGFAAVVGDHRMQVVSLLVTALIGGFTWTALAVLRVAAYRRSEPGQGPRQGM